MFSTRNAWILFDPRSTSGGVIQIALPAHILRQTASEASLWQRRQVTATSSSSHVLPRMEAVSL